MTIRIGDRMQMTPRGERLARARGLLACSGKLLDLDRYASPSQVYVQRDSGGCEWWPERCWEVGLHDP